jgi:hypothetical protein
VVDGTCLDVPDSPANQALGRAKSGRGEGVGAFPQVRVVGLVEAGTHAIIDAVQGPYSTGEQTLARGLARDGGPLGPGVLLLADRLFVGAELWRAMAGTGADLVWRTKCGSKTIGGGIQLGADGQPGAGGGRGDAVDDDFVAGQRPAAPVGGDVGKQPVLDLG